MLKNKKGFTLIELLVAIALIISITVVAIVSITKVSEGSKEQSYELVKEQVKTAALEFFSANEYLFEGIVNAEGKITAKRLVEEGYLNALTNPITGKKLNGCDYIEVSKSNGKYNYNFKTDNSPNCPYNSYIITKAKEDPEISVASSCNKTVKNNWCPDTETVTVTVEKGTVSDIKYQINGDVNDDSLSMTVVDNGKKFEFKDNISSPDIEGTPFQISIPGTSISSYGTYYIDNTIPKVEFISKIYGEDNYAIDLDDDQILTKDDISNLKYELEDDKGNVIKQGFINEFVNYSGNWTNKDVVVMPYIDFVGPSGIETLSCNYENNGTNNTLKNGYSLFTRKNLDTTLYCSATTRVGYSSTSGTILKVDENPPTCEITEFGKDTIASSYDSSTSKKFELKTADNLSGISKSVISNSTIGNLDNYSSSNVLNLNIGSNSFSLNGKVRDNAGNENICNTGTIAVNTGSDCSIRVVANDPSKKFEDWYNIATGQPQIQSLVNGAVVDTQNAYEGSYSYPFAPGYQCKNTPSAVNVKYDPRIPTVDLIMKKKNSSSDLTSSSSITSLSNYTNGEIYKGYVFTKTNYTAGPSGATVTCSDTNYDYILGGTHGPYNNFSTYRNVNREGVTTIRCTATSGSGNTSSEITKTIKLERNLKMVLNEERTRNVTAKSTGYTKKVFNTSKGAKYYSTTDKMGCEGCSAIGAPNSAGNYVYMGTACKNVVDYERHFMIYSPIDSAIITTYLTEDETEYKGEKGKIFEDLSQAIKRYGCNFNNLGSNKYNWNCGSATGSGTPNLTRHYYKYTAKSGASSKYVVLFTRYSASCGY